MMLQPLTLRNGLRRLYSSKPAALPLEGYRVLDMSRVLAGVSEPVNALLRGLG